MAATYNFLQKEREIEKSRKLIYAYEENNFWAVKISKYLYPLSTSVYVLLKIEFSNFIRFSYKISNLINIVVERYMIFFN